jgi:2-polyprenyl-3-methyl-5-hydroxy-6-metoxy-1,4-benzoquinol methylase
MLSMPSTPAIEPRRPNGCSAPHLGSRTRGWLRSDIDRAQNRAVPRLRYVGRQRRQRRRGLDGGSQLDVRWGPHFERLQGQFPTLLGFAISWWHYNVPMLDRVRLVLPPPARVLEVGTGTGALSVLLASHGYQVVGVDIDADVVDEARQFAEYFRVDCDFEIADAFDLSAFEGQFDLAFSSGLIEHFTHQQAVEILRQQARVARYVMVIIPTWHSLRNDPATEATHARAIWRRELEAIVREAGLRIAKRFGYGAPGGRFEFVYQFVLPRLIQRYLQNHLSYAATIGCIATRVR